MRPCVKGMQETKVFNNFFQSLPELGELATMTARYSETILPLIHRKVARKCNELDGQCDTAHNFIS